MDTGPHGSVYHDCMNDNRHTLRIHSTAHHISRIIHMLMFACL